MANRLRRDGMKTLYCCPECGSTHVYADAWSALNWEEVLTYDDMRCLACGAEVNTLLEADVPDDTDAQEYIHPATFKRAGN